MQTFRVEVTKFQMMTFARWQEYELVCYLNDQLREMNAPYVIDAFLSPDLWREKILKQYESFSATSKGDLCDTMVYTFKLGDPDANSKN